MNYVVIVITVATTLLLYVGADVLSVAHARIVVGFWPNKKRVRAVLFFGLWLLESATS